MEIARIFGVSVKTVETYRQRIKDKLNLSSSAQLRQAAQACWGAASACLGFEGIMGMAGGDAGMFLRDCLKSKKFPVVMLRHEASPSISGFDVNSAKKRLEMLRASA